MEVFDTYLYIVVYNLLENKNFFIYMGRSSEYRFFYCSVNQQSIQIFLFLVFQMNITETNTPSFIARLLLFYKNCCFSVRKIQTKYFNECPEEEKF